MVTSAAETPLPHSVEALVELRNSAVADTMTGAVPPVLFHAGAPVDWVAQDPVFTKFQPIGVAAKAPHPNAAKLFVDFMLSEEGQKIIASFGRVPTRRAVATNVQGLDKLNFVIDEFSAGDDFNKNYEQFRNVFGAAKQ